jgi:hypothetical protein
MIVIRCFESLPTALPLPITVRTVSIDIIAESAISQRRYERTLFLEFPKSIAWIESKFALTSRPEKRSDCGGESLRCHSLSYFSRFRTCPETQLGYHTSSRSRGKDIPVFGYFDAYIYITVNDDRPRRIDNPRRVTLVGIRPTAVRDHLLSPKTPVNPGWLGRPLIPHGEPEDYWFILQQSMIFGTGASSREKNCEQLFQCRRPVHEGVGHDSNAELVDQENLQSRRRNGVCKRSANYYPFYCSSLLVVVICRYDR